MLNREDDKGGVVWRSVTFSEFHVQALWASKFLGRCCAAAARCVYVCSGAARAVLGL